jgi:predicted nucleic acid-binding Zn ribbon protein
VLNCTLQRTPKSVVPTLPRDVSRTRRANAAPQPVGDLVARFLDRSGLAPRVAAATVLTDWATLVGPQIAAVTTATGLQEGTLFVAVANSAWMMELNLMKGALIKRVNTGRTEGRIEHIVFVMAA